MKSILVITWSVFLTLRVFAQSGDPDTKFLMSFTGNEFMTLCDTKSGNRSVESNLDKCRMYLNGYAQAMMVARWDAAESDKRAGECVSNLDDVTNQQLLDVVLKHLRDNPARRQYRIGILAYSAINEAWPSPCTSLKGKDNPKSSDSAPPPAASTAQTITTFRGHVLGESWREFVRTEAGLCQSKSRAENCSQAAAGKKVDVAQFGKDGAVIFTFEYGRFASATVSMSGPSFAELTYFEKTYGKPNQKFSHPERGTADSYWYFSDGGEAHAEETKAKSDEFTIMFTIQASDYAMRPGPLAANSYTPIFNGHSLGESWEKFVRTGGGLCQLSEDNAQACKDAAAGESAFLVGQSAENLAGPSFRFWSSRLMEAGLTMRVPKFVELDYLDKTYGRPYYKDDDPERGYATARWDYSDGGHILATEMFVAPQGFIKISAKTVLPH